MVGLENNKKEDVAGEGLGSKTGAVALVLQFFVLVFGVVSTIVLFLMVSQYIGLVVDEEHEYKGQVAVEPFTEYFSDLSDSFSSIVTSVRMGSALDRAQAVQLIRKSLPRVEQFDGVIWVYEDAQGQWRYNDLYNDKSGENFKRHYGLNVDSKLLSYLKQKKLLVSSGINILTDLSFVVHEQSAVMSGGHVAPFAISQAVSPGNAKAGVVIAVASAIDLLRERDVFMRSRFVRSVFVRDVLSGYNVLRLESEIQENAGEEKVLQAYEFLFGNKKWEVNISLFPSSEERFLRSLPLICLVLGFMITVLLTLHVRGRFEQYVQVYRVNKRLEEKNVELEIEMSKRESLNSVLQKSEKDHRSIIDAVSDVILETNIKGEIVFLSARWRKVTGFDLEQSRGLNLFKMLHPEDQKRIEDDFNLLVNGQKQAFRSFTRLRTSNGRLRAIELAFSMLRQDEDRELRVVGTITDVEERRRAERALGEAEKKYRAIVENAAGGIFQITPEGLYLSANPALARILGYDSPENILRSVKNANEQVYASARERQSFIKELEERGSINNYETRVIRKNGDIIWINENARVVKDDSNNTLYYEGSIEDITQRKETDLALREAKVRSDLANRAKSEFLANMSHELRTPLNAIIGFSEIIKNQSFGEIQPSSYWEYAKDIHESGTNLLQVINEILDISKIEAGERQLNESEVDFSDVCLSCFDLLSNKIQANNMTVTNDLHDVPILIVEELAMKQVIMNLLGNAIKFTPKGGRITVTSARGQGGDFRLSITDTGIGLDEHEVEKALSPFGQIQNELSRSNSGTGLGLTLSDALVRFHGGNLEIFSQKGIGTTVTIVLPASRVCGEKKKAAAAESKSGHQEEA